MKRGEIWTLQDEGYASKARPVVIIQSDAVNEFDSVVLTLLTSFDNPSASTRVQIEPSTANGLKKTSYVMTEKILTVRRTELGIRVGMLTEEQMSAVSHQLAVVLDISRNDVN